jgi:hypothetical protein
LIKGRLIRKILNILLVYLFFYVLAAIEPEKFLTDDAEILYYTKAGSGPKVVLLCSGPGFGAILVSFWLDTLASDFESILLEQRGNGLSRNAKVDSITINIERACEYIENLRQHLYACIKILESIDLR